MPFKATLEVNELWTKAYKFVTNLNTFNEHLLKSQNPPRNVKVKGLPNQKEPCPVKIKHSLKMPPVSKENPPFDIVYSPVIDDLQPTQEPKAGTIELIKGWELSPRESQLVSHHANFTLLTTVNAYNVGERVKLNHNNTAFELAKVVRVDKVKIEATEMELNGERLYASIHDRDQLEPTDNEFAERCGFKQFTDMADYIDDVWKLPYVGYAIKLTTMY